jgi:hypothetical protein
LVLKKSKMIQQQIKSSGENNCPVVIWTSERFNRECEFFEMIQKSKINWRTWKQRWAWMFLGGAGVRFSKTFRAKNCCERTVKAPQTRQSLCTNVTFYWNKEQ